MNTPGQLKISANGYTFTVFQQADKPRVLFLHGFGSDYFSWEKVWQRLGPEFPLAGYDLRGFGQNDGKINHEFRHELDLFAVMDALAIERCHLVGVSMGGAIALRAALDKPERIERLVLISPAIQAWQWSDEWKHLWREIVGLARNGNMDQARAKWLGHPLFESTRASDNAPLLASSIARFSGNAWLENKELPSLPDIERLHELSVPTLLLTGGLDFSDFRLIAEVIEASAPTVTRKNYPNNGHLLQLEQPDAIANDIANFLEINPSD